MKAYLFIFLLLFCIGSLAAQDRVGVGLELGVIDALNANIRTPLGSSTNILLSGGEADRFFVQGTYDFHIASLTDRDPGEFEFYAGPGLFIRTPEHEDTRFGFAGNFGIGWLAQRHLEFVVEASPKLAFAPVTETWFTAGLGFRFIF